MITKTLKSAFMLLLTVGFTAATLVSCGPKKEEVIEEETIEEVTPPPVEEIPADTTVVDTTAASGVS